MKRIRLISRPFDLDEFLLHSMTPPIDFKDISRPLDRFESLLGSSSVPRWFLYTHGTLSERTQGKDFHAPVASRIGENSRWCNTVGRCLVSFPTRLFLAQFRHYLDLNVTCVLLFRSCYLADTSAKCIFTLPHVFVSHFTLLSRKTGTSAIRSSRPIKVTSVGTVRSIRFDLRHWHLLALMAGWKVATIWH